MSPSFAEGDYVVSCNWLVSRCRKGQVVVVEHLRLGTIIKRVIDRHEHQVLLVGDNLAQSTSTQTMGWQPIDRIVGCVIWHISGS